MSEATVPQCPSANRQDPAGNFEPDSIARGISCVSGLRVSLLAACLLVAVPGLADWNDGEPAKWVQMPDLSPMGIDVNASIIGRDFVLADDWECTATERITNIHIWGSWYHDILPQGFDPNAVEFTLSIHADIPASQNPDGYSMPGDLLWMHHFPAGTFTARRYASDIVEGWMDPPDLYEPIGDWTCWQYNFTLPEDNIFAQLGTPDDPIVYWLDVKAVPLDRRGSLRLEDVCRPLERQRGLGRGSRALPRSLVGAGLSAGTRIHGPAHRPGLRPAG